MLDSASVNSISSIPSPVYLEQEVRLVQEMCGSISEARRKARAGRVESLPMEERLPPEHYGELLSDPLEQILDKVTLAEEKDMEEWL